MSSKNLYLRGIGITSSELLRIQIFNSITSELNNDHIPEIFEHIIKEINKDIQYDDITKLKADFFILIDYIGSKFAQKFKLDRLVVSDKRIERHYQVFGQDKYWGIDKKRVSSIYSLYGLMNAFLSNDTSKESMELKTDNTKSDNEITDFIESQKISNEELLESINKMTRKLNLGLKEMNEASTKREITRLYQAVIEIMKHTDSIRSIVLDKNNEDAENTFDSIIRKLNRMLVLNEVEAYSSVGEEYNPDIHEVIKSTFSHNKNLTVSKTIEQGYKLNNKVLIRELVEVEES